MSNLQSTGAFLGVIFTALLGWWGLRQKQDKSDATKQKGVDGVLHDGIKSLIGELQEELSRIRELANQREKDYQALYDKQRVLEAAVAGQVREMDALKARVRLWADGIRMLVAQIRDLGHDPVWGPDDPKEEP